MLCRWMRQASGCPFCPQQLPSRDGGPQAHGIWGGTDEKGKRDLALLQLMGPSAL